MSQSFSRTICIAPMIAWSDRHYRYMMRLITKKTMLYTEMVSANAIIHGPRERLLRFSTKESPVTLQLGGNDPKDLVYCAKLAESLGFNEINLNVGCPSDRVSKGAFGLSLMYKPELVAECVYEMKKALSIPVSVKCRTGVDELDSFEYLNKFIKGVVDSGADFICIHARKGWLNGLSPAQNRTIPPLNYETVYQIKQNFPHIAIGINGGITSFESAQKHLKHVDSVMIGREAYHNPMLFKDADHLFHHQPLSDITPFDITEGMVEYIEKEMHEDGCRLSNITRHTLNLFNGYPNARAYRRYLSENATKENATVQVFKDAVNLLR